MVPDDDLLRLERGRTRPPRFRVERSPILILDDAGDGNAHPRIADVIAGRTAHAALQPRASNAPGTRSPSGDKALTAWRSLQDQFDAVCVGLVAEGDAGIAGACRILAGSWADGTAPGATALLGFSPDVVATCVRLTGCPDGTTGSGGLALPVLSEWPPMVIFLPANDAAIGECAEACRRMRSAGIPIRLEIMRSMWTTLADAAIDELVKEIDRFFATHLIPSFPKRF